MVNKSQTTLHAHVKVRIIFSRHSWNIRINPLRYTVYTIRKKSFWKLRIQRLKVRNCSWDILDTMRRSFDSIDQTFAALVNKAYGVLTIEMNHVDTKQPKLRWVRGKLPEISVVLFNTVHSRHEPSWRNSSDWLTSCQRRKICGNNFSKQLTFFPRVICETWPTNSLDSVWL